MFSPFNLLRSEEKPLGLVSGVLGLLTVYGQVTANGQRKGYASTLKAPGRSGQVETSQSSRELVQPVQARSA
jgi:hypothetical protein